ncbi:MAG: hypothetical protein ACFFHV_11870 [Promethearchaeota archaeon]
MRLKNLYTKIIRRIIKENEKTIHVEAFIREDVWNNLKKLIGNQYTWFITTPANYDYCRCYFNLKVTKEEFTNILKNRIGFLKDHNEEIQLHLHLCNVKNFLDKDLQDEKFEEAMMFMHDVAVKPIKFAPGWNAYDDYTLKLVKKYGFKYLYVYTKEPLDLNRPHIKNGLIIKYYSKFWHDYDFIKN